MRALAIGLLMMVACRGEGGSGTELPADRPDDFEIQVSRHGGRQPTSSIATLAPIGGRRLARDGELERRITFEISAAELDAVWQACRDNGFDTIRTRTEKVFDRGGITVRLRGTGRTWKVVDAGGTFISDADQHRFNAVVDAVDQLVDPHVELE